MSSPPPPVITLPPAASLDPILEIQHNALIGVLSGLNIGAVITVPIWTTPVPSAQRAYADFALGVLHQVRQALPATAPHTTVVPSDQPWDWAKNTRPPRP